MAVDSDEEDFVFYGTPIEREEDTSARKRKAVSDAGALRALPAWKEEVRDEEGRRRFRGAFTGGFSAGYYNTVGSKEGWTPQTFTSSRKSRAEVKQQSIYNFLDDEDIKGMGGHAIETSLQFDTFGFTAAEIARKQAENEQQKRPSAIPGPIPDEIVVPAANSIGMKLLLKMGWRHGRSIGDTHAEFVYEARREARKAFLAFSGNEEGPEHGEIGSNVFESEECTWKSDDDLFSAKTTPVYVLHPKQDLHGLGYDPFKHAPEFRDRKRLRESRKKDRGYRSDVSIGGNLLASNSGKYAPGFGIGALEELDLEDEDIYASGFDFEQTEVEEDEPSQMIIDNKHKLEDKVRGTLPGFKVASSSGYNLERFQPPVVPPDFEPYHKFSSRLETLNNFSELPPPEAPPPEDNNLRLLIDGFANLVARCGRLFEDLSREKNKSNPLFSFLNGGNGHNYYARKLWEAKQRNVDKQRPDDVKSLSSAQKMTAENRGRILGEKPLERSSNEPAPSVTVKEVIHLQSNLAETFTKPASQVGLSEAVKPFKDDPAKQERFEQFLKDKYQGGLRSMGSGGTNIISEADRARERLDFEAAAEALEKGNLNCKTDLLSIHQSMDLSGFGRQNFISSSGVEKNQISQDEENMKKIYPKREEFQWRPSPILCKRFDINDPFMGKPPPLPRPRSKMDSLIFTTEFIKSTNTEETDAVHRDSMLKNQPEMQEDAKQLSVAEPEIKSSPKNVERPVDLYKAIFSDDSDEDEDKDSFNQVTEPENKTEGANTTLNRLIAGDFLESLGKELGLEVPHETSLPPFKANSSALLTETIGKDLKISSMNDQSTLPFEMSRAVLVNKDSPCRPRSPENGRNTAADKLCDNEVSSLNRDGLICGNSKRESLNIGSQRAAAGGTFHDVKEDQVQAEKRENQLKHTPSTIHQCRSSSRETDSSSGRRRAKKGRTRSRHHRSKHSTPDSDSSDERHQPKRSRTHSRRHQSRSCSPDNDSPDDQRRAKKRTQSRHHRGSRTPDSDSPSDHRYGDRSRSRVEKRLSEGKNRRHSRHNKYR